MKKSYRAFIAAGMMAIAGCSDRALSPTGPASTTGASDVSEPPPAPGVGTLGVIDDIKPQEQGLVVYQTGLDYEPPPGAKFQEVRHEFAVGSRHNKLQVQVKDDTKIYINGVEKKLGDLQIGTKVLVVGRVTGSALHAEMITDLGTINEPPEDLTGIVPQGMRNQLISHARVLSSALASPLSLCMGQDLDYTDPHILEFQGCWGGPSASDDLDLPFIPLFCPLIGCVGIDRFSYTMALGGWSFAFPFKFKADATPGLVYHVPGNVSLSMQPLPATTGSFSFAGGVGMDFGLNFDFCSFFGCYNLYTVHLAAFSMIHQATAAGPIDENGRLEIGETSCPSVGLIPIEGIPIDPFSIGFCEDLGLNGKPFNMTVTSFGASSPSVLARYAFTTAGATARLRPDAMQVGMRFDNFAWSPGMTMGLFFRFKTFGITRWNSPTIPFGEVGLFDAVSTPFPSSGSPFTVATDPLSDPSNLQYLLQPTAANVSLAVAPAQTSLSITSGNLLTEGTPVTVRLSETYDGSSIAGHAITLQADGLNGTSSASVTAMTNSGGIASVVLPVGEYHIVARYAGAAMYLPSTADQMPVYIYRPTTFVIWGGNSDGIAVVGRHQFWGQGWVSQVTAASFGGNPSFQGFAIPTSVSTWESPPANAGRGPESVPDLIGVIITTDVQRRGSNSTGNIAGHAVLRVDDPAAYRPDPGHAAWGVVRAQIR